MQVAGHYPHTLRTPAGFERVIIHAGIPATHFEQPKPGLDMNLSQPDLMKLFKKIGMHVV